MRALRISLHEACFSGDDRPVVAAFEQWRWLDDARLVRPLISAAAGLEPYGSGPALWDRVVDVIASLPPASPGGAIARRPHATWLIRARERLDEEVSPPRLSALAREAGVHPVHFAACFRRAFGCSVGNYIRWRRVTMAVSRLATKDESLSMVAHQAGFSDQPHLARAFRAEFGVPPRNLRRVVRPLSIVQDRA
jgi:AraC family transcriptional regulator